MNGIVERAVSCLGRGFDVTNDFRLKFCKGKSRLVLINESEAREIVVPGFGPLKDVSFDIKCDKGDRIRYQSDVLEFNQMSGLFNQKSSLSGKIPSGLFNSMFGFGSGTWARDASETKCLAMDGYFITLFNLQIDRYPLILTDHVRNAVPSTWQPHALARFIETYGTHIIVGMSVGGQDVVFVRQDQSSCLQTSEIKKHLDKLGDELFTGSCTLSPLHWKTKGHKNKGRNPPKDIHPIAVETIHLLFEWFDVHLDKWAIHPDSHQIPEAFNVFDPQPELVDSFRSVRSKDGITVICSKRGGDATTNSHCEWLETVPLTPDAINFNFVPITSLLKDVPGSGFLSHAINLYLRYKPPVAELQYFLDFQSHKMWAPVHSDLPLGPPTNKAIPTPSLQFNFIGPKLYVNTAQVTVGRSPVTGMRLYLEGQKCNRLAIHLQHLSTIPRVLENQVDNVSIWKGSDEVGDERYYEPVQRKKFSHVCIAPVKYDPTWAHGLDAAFVVTGAQLHVAKHESQSKHVLHLRLLFSKVSNSVVCRSAWEQGLLGSSQKSGFSSTGSSLFKGSSDDKEQQKQKQVVIVDSAVYPTGPPVPVQTQKLVKFVDTSHVCRGPQDSPGHWLVTGAKLDLEKGKISLHVKFSLLSFSS